MSEADSDDWFSFYFSISLAYQLGHNHFDFSEELFSEALLMVMAAPSRFDGLELPASADFHVHLRDGPLMNAVVPLIRAGGVNMVYVMVGGD